MRPLLLPAPALTSLRKARLPLAVEIDCRKYLTQRVDLLHDEFSGRFAVEVGMRLLLQLAQLKSGQRHSDTSGH